MFTIAVGKSGGLPMHSFAKVDAPPIHVVLYCPCDKVYHKQEVRFILY